jgi:uncharacterized cupredoxin-like copper-binding protein
MSRQIAVVAALATSLGLLVGCGSTTRAPSTSAEATVVPSIEIPAGATRVSLAVPVDKREGKFQLDGKPITELQVKAGVPYVFDVENLGTNQHNFWIGDAKDLAAREYDRLIGTHLWSEGRRSIVYTFHAGQKVQWACTLAGHYGLMHGDFLIAP